MFIFHYSSAIQNCALFCFNWDSTPNSNSNPLHSTPLHSTPQLHSMTPLRKLHSAGSSTLLTLLVLTFVLFTLGYEVVSILYTSICYFGDSAACQFRNRISNDLILRGTECTSCAAYVVRYGVHTTSFARYGVHAMSSSQATLRCSFLSPTHGFIRKVFLVPHHIFKERGMFKLYNRSSQFATWSSGLKLKSRADLLTSPGTLC